MCPRIAEIEYHPTGAIKRVKFRDGATTQPVPSAALGGGEQT
jgi:hypothetical protein